MPIFSWSALVLGSTATSMTGSGNSIRSRMIGAFGRAQGVAGGGVLEADQGDDVAGIGLLDVLAVVGVHQQHAADLLLLVLDRVHHRRGALELARIDAGEGQGADERVGHDLEGQSGEGRRVVGRAGVLGLAVHLEALDRGTSSGLGR